MRRGLLGLPPATGLAAAGDESFGSVFLRDGVLTRFGEPRAGPCFQVASLLVLAKSPERALLLAKSPEAPACGVRLVFANRPDVAACGVDTDALLLSKLWPARPSLRRSIANAAVKAAARL